MHPRTHLPNPSKKKYHLVPDGRNPFDSAKDLLTHVHALARITRGRGEEVETGFDQGASERKLRELLRRVEREKT